jgi:membrane protease YdiL (CAAX protease family)
MSEPFQNFTDFQESQDTNRSFRGLLVLLLASAVILVYLVNLLLPFVKPVPPAPGNPIQQRQKAEPKTAQTAIPIGLPARISVLLKLNDRWKELPDPIQNDILQTFSMDDLNLVEQPIVTRRRCALVQMWLKPTKKHFQNLIQVARENQSISGKEEKLWTFIYQTPLEETSLTADQWEQIEPTLKQLELDWYETLVHISVQQQLGHNPEIVTLKRALQQDIISTLVPLFLLVTGLLVTAFIGFISGIVFLVIYLRNPIRFHIPRPTTITGNPNGHHIQLWETFTLYLAIPLVCSLFWLPVGPNIEVQLYYSIAIQLTTATSLLWLYTGNPPIALRDIGWNFKRIGANIGWGFLGYAMTLPLLPLAGILALFLQALLPEIPPPSHPIQELLGNAPSGLVITGLFLMATILAPLIEETLFRGVLTGALLSRLSPLGAIVISSVVFALVHPQGIIALPPLFTLGASFAVLRHFRGSLIPGIIAHAINNMVALSFMLLFLVP